MCPVLDQRLKRAERLHDAPPFFRENPIEQFPAEVFNFLNRHAEFDGHLPKGHASG